MYCFKAVYQDGPFPLVNMCVAKGECHCLETVEAGREKQQARGEIGREEKGGRRGEEKGEESGGKSEHPGPA